MQVAHMHGVFYLFGLSKFGKWKYGDKDFSWFEWKVLQDTYRLVLQSLCRQRLALSLNSCTAQTELHAEFSDAKIKIKETIESCMLPDIEQLVRSAYWYVNIFAIDDPWVGATDSSCSGPASALSICKESLQIADKPYVFQIFNRYKVGLFFKECLLKRLENETDESLQEGLLASSALPIQCVILESNLYTLQPCCAMKAMVEYDFLLAQAVPDKPNHVIGWMFEAQFKAMAVYLQGDNTLADNEDEKQEQKIFFQLLRNLLKLNQAKRHPSSSVLALKDLARYWCALDANQVDFRGKKVVAGNVSQRPAHHASAKDNAQTPMEIWGAIAYTTGQHIDSVMNFDIEKVYCEESDTDRNTCETIADQCLLLADSDALFANLYEELEKIKNTRQTMYQTASSYNAFSSCTDTKEQECNLSANNTVDKDVLRNARFERNRIGKQLLKLDLLVRCYHDQHQPQYQKGPHASVTVVSDDNLVGLSELKRFAADGFQLLIDLNQAFIELTQDLGMQKLEYLKMLLFWSQRAYELVLMQEYEIPIWIEATRPAVDDACHVHLQQCRQYFTECNELVLSVCNSLKLFSVRSTGNEDANDCIRFGYAYQHNLEVVKLLEQSPTMKEEIQALMITATQQCKAHIDALKKQAIQGKFE
jgi:hypothetical protein